MAEWRRQNSHKGKATTLVSQITNYKRCVQSEKHRQEPAKEKQPLDFLNQDLNIRKGPRVCFSTCPGTHGAWAQTWCGTSQRASSNLSTMASSDQGDLPQQMCFLSATPWLLCPWPHATPLSAQEQVVGECPSGRGDLSISPGSRRLRWLIILGVWGAHFPHSTLRSLISPS